jgi:2',3'-cyclic-nucleotide 2'-phosphodiesterase (5'-nucleotidase family)
VRQLLVTIILAIGFGLTAILGAFGQPPAENRAKTVSLVYIADLHGQLEEHPELFWSEGREQLVKRAGGVARIAAAVAELRRERAGAVLFMDAGDTIQGSAIAAWSEGRDVVGAVNALGLDLGLPGNWEVVYGAKVLEKRLAEFHYPWIAANVFDAASGKRLLPPYLMREINGVRVGVLGYTDPDVPTRQPPSYSDGLRYAGEEILPGLVKELREKQRADVVVLLTHIGLPKAVRLAEQLQGVDVVLSGDTHERTYEPIVRGNTWVVEPGSFGSFLGRLDLTVDNGRLVSRHWELIELHGDRFPEDPKVQQLVAAAVEPNRARLQRVIGRTSAPLMRYAVLQTTLDAMLADALREAAGTELALSNGFRFAAPTLPGAITEADLWNWYPITTRLKVGRVTGRQLRNFWEQELEHVFSRNPDKLFGGWLPRPSGMTIRFRAHAPAGQRVQEIRIQGKPLEDERVYTLAACEREGDAPDTLCRIRRVAEPRVLDVEAHEAVRQYLERHSPAPLNDTPRVLADDMPRVLRSQYYSRP